MFDWTWVDTILVPIANFVLAPLIKRAPETGWLRNKFIPRWIAVVAFAVGVVQALTKLNEAAGISMHGDGVALAGFSIQWLYTTVLVPAVKAALIAIVSAGAHDKVLRPE